MNSYLFASPTDETCFLHNTRLRVAAVDRIEIGSEVVDWKLFWGFLWVREIGTIMAIRSPLFPSLGWFYFRISFWDWFEGGCLNFWLLKDWNDYEGKFCRTLVIISLVRFLFIKILHS